MLHLELVQLIRSSTRVDSIDRWQPAGKHKQHNTVELCTATKEIGSIACSTVDALLHAGSYMRQQRDEEGERLLAATRISGELRMRRLLVRDGTHGHKSRQPAISHGARNMIAWLKA